MTLAPAFIRNRGESYGRLNIAMQNGLKLRRLGTTFILTAVLAFGYEKIVLANDATLSWSANTEPNLAGYKLYYGTASRVYNNVINVGLNNTYAVTGLGAGTYYFSLSAYNSSGAESGLSNEVTKTFAASGDTPGTPSSGTALASINFQPSNSLVPSGYQMDDGSVFVPSRGYGWDVALQSRERELSTDQRLDTLVFSQNPATWNYNIANGNYLISFACGDPGFGQGPHRVEIEGIRVVNDVATTGGTNFISVSDFPVTVSDGQLTVRIGGTTGNTTLNYLVIKTADSASPSLLPAPTNVRVK